MNKFDAVAVNGFGCEGCYNLEYFEYTIPYVPTPPDNILYYCKGKLLDKSWEVGQGDGRVSFTYPIIFGDLATRPIWCPNR